MRQGANKTDGDSFRLTRHVRVRFTSPSTAVIEAFDGFDGNRHGHRARLESLARLLAEHPGVRSAGEFEKEPLDRFRTGSFPIAFKASALERIEEWMHGAAAQVDRNAITGVNLLNAPQEVELPNAEGLLAQARQAAAAAVDGCADIGDIRFVEPGCAVVGMRQGFDADDPMNAHWRSLFMDALRNAGETLKGRDPLFTVADFGKQGRISLRFSLKELADSLPNAPTAKAKEMLASGYYTGVLCAVTRCAAAATQVHKDGVARMKKAQAVADAVLKQGDRARRGADVFGHAQVYDSAQVYGGAEVYGLSKVFGEARVCGNAKVLDWAEVSGSARVYKTVHVAGRDVLSKEHETGLPPASVPEGMPKAAASPSP